MINALNKGTIVFDFDGVIHSYDTGSFKTNDYIPNEPVEGIKEAIDNIRNEGYEVVVVSARCSEESGRLAILDYLAKHEIKVDKVLRFKPPALCYIDDRAICFDGHSETLLDKIKNFKPWHDKD